MDERVNDKSKTHPGTPTAEYVRMELARALPRLLDSSRPDGGINRLMTDPGGRLFENAPDGKKVLALFEDIPEGSPGWELLNTVVGGPQFKDDVTRPLLIQHEAEGEQDFRHRAALAAPRNGYWRGITSLAGRPFKNPIKVSANSPSSLGDDGEWAADADLRGNSIRTLLSRAARESAGYGLHYLWSDYNRAAKRPYVRMAGAESVVRVMKEREDLRRLHMLLSREEYSNEEDRFDPSKMPRQKKLVLVFRDGDSRATNDKRWANYEVYESEDEGGKVFKTEKQPQEIEGRMLDYVSLEPHVKMPIIPMPAGAMSENHFILPWGLEAAQLDYLALQMSSSSEFAARMATAFIRFAKGLKKQDIDAWRVLGPQFFYATTAENADMKWVTMSTDAVQAGMEITQHLMRAVEVAVLAPMITRMPGDEKATGMAMAGASASSSAVGIYLQWEAAAGALYTAMALHDPSFARNGKVTANMEHGVHLTEQARAHADYLMQLYMDPARDFPAAQFYAHLRKLGVLAEDADMDEIIAAAEDPKLALERQQTATSRGDLLLHLVEAGHFGTRAAVETLYLAMYEQNLLPRTDDVERAARDLATAWEVARRRRRNHELYLAGDLITIDSYWKQEQSDQPEDVVVEDEKEELEPDDPGDDPFGLGLGNLPTQPGMPPVDPRVPPQPGVPAVDDEEE